MFQNSVCRYLPIFLVGPFLWLGESGLAAQVLEDWPPIPPADLVLADNPVEPGSSAMILLKRDFRDDIKGTMDVYRRIKVFNAAGREHANLEIPFLRGRQEVQDFAGRVTQPDGQTIEFRGPIYDKTILRARKVRMLAKTLTLPEVQAGSIIEYGYRVKSKGFTPGGQVWIVQEPLFVREANLSWRQHAERPGQFLARGLRPGSGFHPTGGLYTSILKEIPAFIVEPYMPPEQVVVMHYQHTGMLGSVRGYFATLLIEQIQETFDEFIGKPRKFHSVVNTLVSRDEPGESQLRNLYAAVQRLRNLSYEEALSKKERKRERLKDRKSARDVWDYGYGTADELNLLFVALVRAAGFPADVALIVPRDTRFFDPEVSLIEQVEDEVAVVEFGDTTFAYDPGTRFAPFGQLSWEKHLTRGIRVGKHSSFEEITTPPMSAATNIRHRIVTVELSPDGSARIRLTIRYEGQEVIEWKNDLFMLSSRQCERRLRESLEKSFPSAEIDLVGFDTLPITADASEEAIEFAYTLTVPDYGILLGSRMLVKPVFVKSKSPFPHWDREHPIYFAYPHTTIEEVIVVPPSGYELDVLPVNNHLQPPMGEYHSVLRNQGDKVLYRKEFTLHKIFFPRGDYIQVKRFFDEVQADNDMYVIFRRH